MGTSAVISRAIGSKNYRKVRRLVFDSLLLGILVVGIGVVAGLFTIRSLFMLLGARGAILDYIAEYMKIWYIGMIFVVVPMVGNNIIRATGDSKTPGIIMTIGAGANFIMDPLLIFGLGPLPAMGVRGAALSTVIGRSLTLLIAMYVLIFREKLLKFTIPTPSELWKSWKEVLHIAIPNAITKMIVPLGSGFITRVVSSYGAEAVAGYGVATRIEFFSLTPVNAISSVLGPFIGQNLGASLFRKVREGFAVSGYFSLFTGSVSFLLFLVFAAPIASVFNDDPAVVSTTALYLRLVSAAYAAQGFYLAASAGLNVMKKPLQAAGLSILEMFVLSVPLALLGSLLFGLAGIFAAISISYAATGTSAIFAVRRVMKGYI
jgi:putative MATE family efflux protein